MKVNVMARVLVNESNLQSIANAIRGKNGLSDTYTPSQMASAISAIPTGGSVTAEFVTVTVDSDKTAVYSILTGNQFLSSHYTDSGFFCILVYMDNTTTRNTIICDMASNIPIGLNSYGFSIRVNGSYMAVVNSASTIGSGQATYNGLMYYENSALKVYATSTRILKAGNYAIIMGVIE